MMEVFFMKNGKTFFYGEILVGLGLFVFGILGIFFEGHDILLMGALMILSLSFFLKAGERKKKEDQQDELLEEDEEKEEE